MPPAIVVACVRSFLLGVWSVLSVGAATSHVDADERQRVFYCVGCGFSLMCGLAALTANVSESDRRQIGLWMGTTRRGPGGGGGEGDRSGERSLADVG